MFAERILKPELLDHVPPSEARPNLADLVRINRRLGGHSTLRKTFARVVQRSGLPFSVLDVGSASGDSARTIGSIYPEARVTSLDYNATNIEAAPAPKLMSNAFALPFLPESFDYVMCSSFLHHFQNEQVIELLQGLYAHARKAIVVIDLERHVLPYLFLALSKPVFGWNRITVHDGLISVKAAFHRHELKELATRAGLRKVEVESYRPAFRLALTAYK